MERVLNRGRCSLAGTLLMTVSLLPVAAQGDPWAGAAGGAVVGGALGAVVTGGGTGAAVGAVLGGVMGAGAGAERRQEAQMNLRKMQAAEAQEWERERRRRVREMQDGQSDQWGVGDSIGADATGSLGVKKVATRNPGGDTDLIVEIQQSIKRLGYDPGVIGTLNRQTVAIIKMYQAQHGLLETGTPSPQLLAHMRKNGG